VLPSSKIFKVADTVPTATGENVTEKLQLAPAAMIEEQLVDT
jgi:hypothetical protein